MQKETHFKFAQAGKGNTSKGGEREGSGIQISQGQELGKGLASRQLCCGPSVPMVSASASLVPTHSPCSAAFEAALWLWGL